MKPITAKEFLTLEIRDFENGAVRDGIYAALKERELLKPLPDTSWEKSKLTMEEAKTMIASLSNTIAELQKQKPGTDKSLDAQFVKVLEAGKKLRAGDPRELEIIEAFLKEYKKPELPEKRALTLDEIISKYPASVRILIVQLVAQIERLQPLELPEITEAWAAKKAKEIWQLIKDAQDEDLSDPVTDLHHLGLALDIVDSIISDLRPKNK